MKRLCFKRTTRGSSERGTLPHHALITALDYCNNVKRGPTDPFFDDMMLQTVGPGFQGGMMMDGSAKIAQDTRERQIVSAV